MIIRGRLLIVGSLIAATLISLAHCNPDEKKDGRAGKPLNPNGPSFMRKRQWTGDTEPRQLTDVVDERPLLQDPTMTLKSALEHLRLRREQQLRQSSRQRMRALRGILWLQ